MAQTYLVLPPWPMPLSQWSDRSIEDFQREMAPTWRCRIRTARKTRPRHRLPKLNTYFQLEIVRPAKAKG